MRSGERRTVAMSDESSSAMIVTGIGTGSNKGSGKTMASGGPANMALPFRVNSAMPAQRVQASQRKKRSVFKREKAKEMVPHYNKINTLKLEQQLQS